MKLLFNFRLPSTAVRRDASRDADSSRVLRQIREFSQQFHQNQFVITCHIAAREYIFEQFTEVEIADFYNERIADFYSQWFHTKNGSIKAERFLPKLEEEEPIRELATSPLLLALLCLVFEDSGSFPTNRAELYQTDVDVLLKKWDVKRNIERAVSLITRNPALKFISGSKLKPVETG